MQQSLCYFEPFQSNLTKGEDFSVYPLANCPFVPLDQQDSLLLASSFCPPVYDGSRYPNTLSDPLSYTFTSPLTNYESSCSSSPSIDFHTLMSVPLDAPTPEMWPIEIPEPQLEVPKKQKKTDPNHKSFACHLCSRCFARKHDLQRHIRVHTGAKPYSCLSCSKAFARTDALKRHLRVEDSCRLSPVIQAMKNTGSRRYRNL